LRLAGSGLSDELHRVVLVVWVLACAQDAGWPALEFLGLVAVEVAHPFVDVEDPSSVGVVDEDGVGDRIEDGPITCYRGAKRLLGTSPRGDVATHPQHRAHLPRLVADGGQVGVEPQRLAQEHDLFLAREDLPGSEDGSEAILDYLATLWREEVADVFADHLVGREVDARSRVGVTVADSKIRPDDEYVVRGGLDHRPIEGHERAKVLEFLLLFLEAGPQLGKFTSQPARLGFVLLHFGRPSSRPSPGAAQIIRPRPPSVNSRSPRVVALIAP